MAYSLVGDKCKCGVVHYSIIGDATRGELKALRERLSHENTILHYLNSEQESIRCICGEMLQVESDESDSESR